MSTWGGGNCVLHGPGARKHWAPSVKTVRDKNGKVKTEYKRVFSYRCDLGPKKTKLRQTTLPFVVKTTPKRRGGGQEDTERNHFSILLPTVGQDKTADE